MGKAMLANAYGVYDFVLDLHEVISSLAGSRLALCSAIAWAVISLADMPLYFPEHVEAVAIIEGLGPPQRAHEANEVAEMQVLQFMILNRLRHQPRRTRPIQNQSRCS